MRLATPLVAAALAVSAALSACAPLVVGAIVAGTAVVATDRRTTGAQVDDATTQLRVSNELSTAMKGQAVHISINSFERKILLTGEVPNEEVKAQAGDVAARTANVRAVVNELTIAPPSTFGQRTGDTTLSGKVRAAFVNTKQIAFNSVDIVTERGIVYLLGFVTEKEGEVAAYVASRVGGVRKVVKVFDYGSPEEVQRRRNPSGPPAPTPATSPATAPGSPPG
jgi:osmotically-inducible protein OsmY